jgi:integrase
MPLTDSAIKTVKAADKPIKLGDGGGLCLLVHPTGKKYWRLNYRYRGKQKTLALGVYPAVTLRLARDGRDDARRLLAQGVDPGEVRAIVKAAVKTSSSNSFGAVAREWLDKWRAGKAPSYAPKVTAAFENDVFPWLGGKAVSEITAPDVLGVLRRIEARGALETAHRTKSYISMVMRYAIATGRAERDPCPDLRGALPAPQGKHFAAITDPDKAAELLQAIDSYTGSYIVRAALALLPLVFVRPGELRLARWADIDLEKAEWAYTVTKTKTAHIVPLSRQAVELLRGIQPITGSREFVFEGQRAGRAISDGTLNRALQTLGINTKEEHTAHGFRAMARTMLHERLDFDPAHIEHQLAHSVPDVLGGAYNRTKFLYQRREMMQRWADYLDELKNQQAA